MNGIMMEKENWLSSCEGTIQGFIENSTRLASDKIDLTLEEYIDFDFQVRLNLAVRIEEKNRTQPGSLSETESRLVFAHAADYEQALIAETRAVLSREETLPQAGAMVLSRPFGEIRKAMPIYSHPRHICHTDDCDNCHGRGHVSCSGCSGSGKKSCFGCSGSGQVMRQRQHYDSYTKETRYENYYESCSSCYGHGQVECSECRGSGAQQCGRCNGEGILTKITELVSVVVPDYQFVYFREDVQQYIIDGLYKANIHNIEQFGNVALATVDSNEETRSIKLIFNANIPFARFHSPLPQAKEDHPNINWIIYGKDPTILDSGHVIELMLKSDLNNLVYSATKGKLLNPFIALSSRKAITTFVESEAHQKMLDANKKDESEEAIGEQLNRAFSTTYIREALTSLTKIVTAVQNWSVVKWGICSSLIVYLLMPFYTAYIHAWYPNLETGQVYLTPFTRWDSQQHILLSLQVLARFCGFFAVVLAVAIPALGYGWRRGWIKWRLGKHLANWSRNQKLIKSRWLVSILLTLMLTTLLLALFPVWVSGNDAMLFGVIPFDKPSQWIIHFVNGV